MAKQKAMRFEFVEERRSVKGRVYVEHYRVCTYDGIRHGKIFCEHDGWRFKSLGCNLTIGQLAEVVEYARGL